MALLVHALHKDLLRCKLPPDLILEQPINDPCIDGLMGASSHSMELTSHLHAGRMHLMYPPTGNELRPPGCVASQALVGLVGAVLLSPEESPERACLPI